LPDSRGTNTGIESITQLKAILPPLFESGAYSW